MELIDYITDLLTDFDEMGFAPTTLCPSPESYAIEWRNKITKAFEELTEENATLHTSCTELEQKCASLTEVNEKIVKNSEEIGMTAIRGMSETKADTVRKMHTEIKERCIKGGIYPAFVARTIDQIAKEMLEGENES